LLYAQQATKMGAKYQLNWDNKATHLICAFQDTPKYREVKGTHVW
jgi:DNA-repair protein XRCC1